MPFETLAGCAGGIWFEADPLRATDMQDAGGASNVAHEQTCYQPPHDLGRYRPIKATSHDDKR